MGVQLFLSFIIALSVTAALIPLLARWAPSLGLTDAPGPRKVHAVPVPRVGGIAMAAGMVALALVAAGCAREPNVDKVPIGTDVQLTRDDGAFVEGTLSAKSDEAVKVDVGPTTVSG